MAGLVLHMNFVFGEKKEKKKKPQPRHVFKDPSLIEPLTQYINRIHKI